MIDAKEARKQSNFATNSLVDSQMIAIEKHIKEAILKGHDVANYYFDISGVVQDKLEELGYTVSSSHHRNETTTQISW